jgi:thiol:disulfide interchange protein
MAAALALGAPVCVAQESAPKPASHPAATASTSNEPIYDEASDARAQIAQALVNAKKNNRRVLIQWGANWCSWCHMLHDTFATDKDIKKKLSYEYDLVLIDVGRLDKNMGLANDKGADLKKHGIPFLTVLDADGKVIANQDTSELEVKGEGAKGHDRAKVLAFLTEHQAPYPSAESVLSAGLAQAKKEHKRVFLHFGAPWCQWCHRLEDWMAQPEVGQLMAKDFVDVKIDEDRTTGAADVRKKYNKTPDGIPWFCALDQDGKVICTSEGNKGNVGFPSSPEEIEHFVGMMKAAKVTMTDADIASLKASLEKDSKKEAGQG